MNTHAVPRHGSVDHSRFAPKTRATVLLTAGIVPALLLLAAFRAPEWQLMRLQFNGYALLSGVPLLIDLGLLLYFVRKPSYAEERLWLLLYIGLACLYAFGEMMQRLSVMPQGALFWTNFITPGAFIPAVSFLFALAYTNQSERRYPGLVTLLFIASGIYAFFANFTNILFVNSASVAVLKAWGWDFNGTSALGVDSYVALLWYMPLFLIAIFRLISFRRHTRNPILRKQSLIFIFSMAIPPLTTAFFLLGLPLLGQTNIVPLGIPIGCAALALLAYGVARYELLTISPTLFSNTMLGLMQEAVVATDESFVISYMNPKAEALLGSKTAGANDRLSLLRLLDPESVPILKRAFSQSSEVSNNTIEIEQLDVQSQRKRQTPVHLLASKLRIGNHNAWIMVLADITRELQVRSVIEHEVQVRTRELHEARAYLVSSINSLEQGFLLVTARGEVELLNSVARKLFISDRQADGRQLVADMLQQTKWAADLAPAIDHALHTHHSKQLSVAREDGTSYEIYVTPVLATDQLLGATVIIQDVTEQKILDRSKDEFFSIASHELRTPLTAIRGNMSMFRDYFPEALKDDSAKQLITDTHDASVRLIEIVNDFLDSSSLEQGKMVFNLEPVNLAPLITNVCDELKLLAEQQHNIVTVEAMGAIPLVMADEGRLRQVFYNIISNANKYAEHATITVAAVKEGDKLRIRITDTGKGISPENQKLLFHKFQQAGDSILTRDNTKGTGLGLYISRLLMTNMHGSVELEHSEVGKGSTFAIVLPIATKEQIANAKPVAAHTAAPAA